MLLYFFNSFSKPHMSIVSCLQDLEKKKTFFCSELVAAAQQAVSRVLTLLYMLTQFHVTFKNVTHS